jgi:hypothetical protein
MNALQLLDTEELERLYEILGVDAGGIALDTGEIDEATNYRFKIENLGQLNWTFRMIDAYNAKLMEIKQLANDEMNRISEWEAKATKNPQAHIDFFEILVMDWAQRSREADSKYKGQTTPYGSIALRKMPIEWKYTDEAKVIKYLEAVEELKEHVKTVTTVGIADKAKIKKALEIKQNVFVINDEVVDVAEVTADDEVIGMQYRLANIDDSELVFDLSTGEFAVGVEFRSAVVVYGTKIVPGITVAEQPDKVTIKRGV